MNQTGVPPLWSLHSCDVARKRATDKGLLKVMADWNFLFGLCSVSTSKMAKTKSKQKKEVINGNQIRNEGQLVQ